MASHASVSSVLKKIFPDNNDAVEANKSIIILFMWLAFSLLSAQTGGVTISILAALAGLAMSQTQQLFDCKDSVSVVACCMFVPFIAGLAFATTASAEDSYNAKVAMTVLSTVLLIFLVTRLYLGERLRFHLTNTNMLFFSACLLVFALALTISGTVFGGLPSQSRRRALRRTEYEYCAPWYDWPSSPEGGTLCSQCSNHIVGFGEYFPGQSCSDYCESFGHRCTHASRGVRASGSWEWCEGDFTAVECSEPIGDNVFDAVCGCEDGARADEVALGTCSVEAEKWPDVYEVQDEKVVCSRCSALITGMGLRYYDCLDYCESIGGTCVAAYEDVNDDCNVSHVVNCQDPFIDTNDGICECHGDITSAETRLTKLTLLGCGFGASLMVAQNCRTLDNKVNAGPTLELLGMFLGLTVDVFPLALELTLTEGENNPNTMTAAAWGSFFAAILFCGISFYALRYGTATQSDPSSPAQGDLVLGSNYAVPPTAEAGADTDEVPPGAIGV